MSFKQIPTSMVAFFVGGACPTGWTEYTALRGKMAVGLVSGGTDEGGAGTALTNQENRAVGQHTDSVTDPGHTHQRYSYSNSSPNWADQANTGYEQRGPWTNLSATTGISIQNAGSVAGTNAPYVQLIACKKD